MQATIVVLQIVGSAVCVYVSPLANGGQSSPDNFKLASHISSNAVEVLDSRVRCHHFLRTFYHHSALGCRTFQLIVVSPHVYPPLTRRTASSRASPPRSRPRQLALSDSLAALAPEGTFQPWDPFLTGGVFSWKSAPLPWMRPPTAGGELLLTRLPSIP